MKYHFVLECPSNCVADECSKNNAGDVICDECSVGFRKKYSNEAATSCTACSGNCAECSTTSSTDATQICAKCIEDGFVKADGECVGKLSILN